MHGRPRLTFVASRSREVPIVSDRSGQGDGVVEYHNDLRRDSDDWL